MLNAPETADPAKKPRRRWFQFRLRTLLIGMVLLAIPLGWFGWQVRAIKHREAVLDLIVRSGGSYLIHTGVCDWQGPFGWQLVGSFAFHGHGKAAVPETPLREGDFKEAPSGLRLWLGDPTIAEIGFPKAAPIAVIKQTGVFPEASVWQDH